jgi:hypothetical protein
MLGNHADHFMLAQMREQVTAITPNAGSPGLTVPDRERAGTAHVNMRRGFGLPGSQRVVSSNQLPGMGRRLLAGLPPGALPGMSGGALPGMSGGALPGMGSGALPGMGDITISTTTILGVGIIAGLYLYMKGKHA